MTGMQRTTWDGLPVAGEPPYGASVLVWQPDGDTVEWLLLHRAHHGRAYEGDWAWGPPSGARLPGERLEQCARRELLEEAGIVAEPISTPCGSAEWPLFAVRVDAPAVVLSPEHDAWEWLPTGAACDRCLPAAVADGIRCVSRLPAARVGAQAPGHEQDR